MSTLMDITAAAIPGATATAILVPVGGATARVPIEATAFAHRKAAAWVLVLARWERPADRAGVVTRVKALKAALTPWVRACIADVLRW